MTKKTLYLFVSIVIIFTYIQPVISANILDFNIVQSSQLLERKSIWPNWRIPSFLKRPSFKDDLIYPDWFEGKWDVNSKIEGDKNKESIFHSAKFIPNSSGKLVADREYNTQSFALSSRNDGFLSVKNDPRSPNRQFAKLSNDRYLETKIIGRLYENINDNIFVTDELILQIFHTPELSRVSQVETLTQFRKCRPDGNNVDKLSSFNICGEQFQAIYNEPGKTLNSLPIRTEKSTIVLSKSHYD
tara:strand:+ start:100 stop:831 length:732 start_codon:yes stop_codon:yes gene_type:complete